MNKLLWATAIIAVAMGAAGLIGIQVVKIVGEELVPVNISIAPKPAVLQQTLWLDTPLNSKIDDLEAQIKDLEEEVRRDLEVANDWLNRPSPVEALRMELQAKIRGP